MTAKLKIKRGPLSGIATNADIAVGSLTANVDATKSYSHMYVGKGANATPVGIAVDRYTSTTLNNSFKLPFQDSSLNNKATAISSLMSGVVFTDTDKLVKGTSGSTAYPLYGNGTDGALKFESSINVIVDSDYITLGISSIQF